MSAPDWAVKAATDIMDNACLTEKMHKLGVYSALKDGISLALSQARDEALEEAASHHDDMAAQHETFRHDAKSDLIEHHTKMARFHLSSAAAIRNLKGKQ